jgi:tetratricopeptide (TPR) repeat protein
MRLRIILFALILTSCAGAPPEPQNARLAQAADYNRRGEAALEHGDYRRALAYYREALRIDLSIEHAEGIAINSINLARAHQLAGETALAHQALDDVLGANALRLAPEFTAAARLRKALLYQSEGKLADASAWAERSEALCKDAVCAWRGTLLNLQARLALARADAPAAHALAERALAINRTRTGGKEMANSLRLQAEANIQQRQFAAALAPLGEALALDKRLGLPDRIEADLALMAEAHAGAGNAEQAREFRLRAASVNKRRMPVE